ncbi:hypothetical protein PCANC_19357 [Puccinia coronata f. sp. avenae]|uniref:Prolyl 4-hydroxylase alpha subunit Fe(2+) 2OG dioxygenase domain-containing protein n=1 Tax=Puccinia coronata f. sp. avenae TaxID=200324 RepID=A0A2N5SDK2_9BASI|nr:hypothetical protein PCANC_19357 [Puccinia coronata f. sp. avenae]
MYKFARSPEGRSGEGTEVHGGAAAVVSRLRSAAAKESPGANRDGAGKTSLTGSESQPASRRSTPPYPQATFLDEIPGFRAPTHQPSCSSLPPTGAPPSQTHDSHASFSAKVTPRRKAARKALAGTRAPVPPQTASCGCWLFNPPNDYPISLLEGFGYGFSFPDNNLSPYHFIPNQIPNDPQIGHPHGPHDGTRFMDDAREVNPAHYLNASTTEDLDFEDSLKIDLNKAFKAIKAPGTFAVWGALPTTPPAGLYVEGVGDIALPLQEQTIRQLIYKSHQAPYGRRSKTLVDVSVRNTWEINGDQLHFFNPAWLRHLIHLSDLVASQLGIKEQIRLDLYKMLIYETGAMFKAHTDTEKTPGMFGTLIICLPLAHTGGEVIVRHHGQTKTLRTSDATQSYPCWYSDVMHEVLPVTSGYRCVLTYNLAIKPGLTRPIATAPDYQRDFLRKTLRVWLSVFKTLKANDLARAQVMQDLTSELPFEIFLALLEKKDEGCPEVDDDDEDVPPWKRPRRCYYDSPKITNEDGTHVMAEITDTSYAVKSLQALDGTVIADDYDFDMELCLEKDPFLDLEIAEEDYEPYMGNWGPSATHWYRRGTLVIVPHSQLGNYLAQCGSENTESAFSYLAGLCSPPTAGEHIIDAMCKLCGPEPINGLSSREIRDILTIALQHSRYQLFKSFAGSHRGELPVTFFDWAKQCLDTLPEPERYDKYQNWIPLLLTGYSSLADRISIVQRISRPIMYIEPISTSWAQEFIIQSINTFAHTIGAPTPEDGRVMVSAAFTLNAPWSNISPLLTLIFDRFQKHPLVGLPPETTSDILRATLLHSDYQLFKSIASCHRGELPTTFFDWAKQWLDTLPELERFEKYKNWIPLPLSGYPSLADRISIVQRISSPTGFVEPTSEPWTRDLIHQSINSFLGTIGMPTADDASVIVSAVFTLNDSWADTSTFLTSIFDRFPQADAATFSLAFLSRFKILTSSTETQFPVSDTMELRRNLSSRFFTGERTPANIIASTNSTPSSERCVGVRPQALVEFVCDLTDFNVNGENLLDSFIQQISTHCTGFPAKHMRGFLMPFFYDLTRALASRSVPLNTAFYQQLAHQLIKRLDEQVLGPCPQSTPSSTKPQVSSPKAPRPQVSCSCGDCKALNRFLRDGSQTDTRFKLAQARRQHLETMVNRNKLFCTHQTEKTGTPRTLVITKSKTLELQDKIEGWKKQQREFYASLHKNIHPDHLKDVLGDEGFARVCSLAGNVLSESDRNSSNLA